MEENDFIKSHINSASWIGITDKNSEDAFKSNFNGGNIGWSNWDSNQPDDGSYFLGLFSGRITNLFSYLYYKFYLNIIKY